MMSMHHLGRTLTTTSKEDNEIEGIPLFPATRDLIHGRPPLQMIVSADPLNNVKALGTPVLKKRGRSWDDRRR